MIIRGLRHPVVAQSGEREVVVMSAASDVPARRARDRASDSSARAGRNASPWSVCVSSNSAAVSLTAVSVRGSSSPYASRDRDTSSSPSVVARSTSSAVRAVDACASFTTLSISRARWAVGSSRPAAAQPAAGRPDPRRARRPAPPLPGTAAADGCVRSGPGPRAPTRSRLTRAGAPPRPPPPVPGSRGAREGRRRERASRAPGRRATATRAPRPRATTVRAGSRRPPGGTRCTGRPSRPGRPGWWSRRRPGIRPEPSTACASSARRTLSAWSGAEPSTQIRTDRGSPGRRTVAGPGTSFVSPHAGHLAEG